jgi:uncharacterized protein YacL
MFTDISNFSKISDYFPILNGSLLADLLIIFATFYLPNIIRSNQLANWYKKYGLSAVIADTLILVIGMIIARALYSKIFGDQFNIFKFAFLVLVVQITHDLVFYFSIIKTLPRGANKMIDMFKDYAQEVNAGAIVGDSIMITMAVLFASIFAGYSNNTNIIILIIVVYLLPYIIHAKTI